MFIVPPCSRSGGGWRRRSRRRGRCRGGRRGGRARGRRRARARRAGARRRWPRAGGRGSSPRRRSARARRRVAVGREQRRRDEDQRIVAGARRLDDRGDRRVVADHEPAEQSRVRRRHAATIAGGADTALTRAPVDSRGVRDLGAGPGRGQARRRAGRRCPAARRRSCWCASRSRPGRSCAPTGSLDDLWAGAADAAATRCSRRSPGCAGRSATRR